MRIEQTIMTDISSVEKIYTEAIAYQHHQTGYSWYPFSSSFIKQEIEEKRNFKVVTDEDEIAGVFSVMNVDPIIWNDDKGKEAIYLHRMAILNNYRGKNIAKRVVEWAMIEAFKSKKKFIRIDTWASNKKLITYYQNLGFRLIGKKQLPPKSNLPAHYNNIEVSLFEIKL